MAKRKATAKRKSKTTKRKSPTRKHKSGNPFEINNVPTLI